MSVLREIHSVEYCLQGCAPLTPPSPQPPLAPEPTYSLPTTSAAAAVLNASHFFCGGGGGEVSQRVHTHKDWIVIWHISFSQVSLIDSA